MPLLILNIVERLFCTEPPESKPAAGFITVALILSPAIVVCAGTTIGNCASSYVPALTNIIAGFVAVGVPMFATACLIEANAESIEEPSDESEPFLET